MECESSIFQIFCAVFYLQNFTHPSSLPSPPPFLPHVDLHPITERSSSSRPMAHAAEMMWGDDVIFLGGSPREVGVVGGALLLATLAVHH